MAIESAKPVVFISHKHSDRQIAETIAQFVKNKSAGNARVHLSSSPDFEGPRFGQPINSELTRALGESDLVILVYTDDREDWSWCMWECGVAVDPTEKHVTAVVVVQCTEDVPKPFAYQLRVDARVLDSVQGFVKALLSTTQFFAHRDEPMTGFAPEGKEVRDFAAELHGALADVIPTGNAANQSTPTSPFLRVRLSSQAAEEIKSNYLAGTGEPNEKIVESGLIVEEEGAGALFGMLLGPSSTLGDVLADWQTEEGNSGQEARWFVSLTDQIEAALAGKMRPVTWAAYRAVKGQTDVPFVAGSLQRADGVEFDVYMVPISPRPVPVRERMLPIEQTYYKNAAVEPLQEILLASLVKEMGKQNVTRLPILDGKSAMSIVHRATINEYLADRAINAGSVEKCTLADLLAEDADALNKSYVAVPPDATIDEALAALNGEAGAQDVFVIEDGLVVGWITNVMFIEG